ncbi:sodium-dependent bicarbonate transport family permease [Rubrivivax rivuli]|uniref:Sodium-dependent bicarbonate transport family permease n=1 Tax=Rubrivivax rivuli TaxID=1862385 RepID=A0A437RAW5_9BURK|nr:sodium-dependent bicarbonate transport family permease [Rubrivivax rivuli]RVU43827.1 sodium-dependent bicarbonate transport family permease [Rubrivivax rivuli]
MQSLLDPAILFFVFGVLAGALKSNLEVPPAISKFLSLYLLMALGMKGGFALSQTPFSAQLFASLGAALLMAFVVPALGYQVLRRHVAGFDAAAIAAAYGSVSAVTFVTATQVMEAQGITAPGHMTVAMVLMESPAIVMAVLLASLLRHGNAARPAGAGAAAALPMRRVLHEAFTDGTHLLLLGSLAVGYLGGEAGKAMMQPFTGDLFKGMLAFFLLDMGLLVARHFQAARLQSPVLIAYAVLGPLLHAALALGLAVLLALPVADTALLMVLSASASYIVVPAVLRHAIPEANPSLYFGLSLGITFPMNILLGIPLYVQVAQWVRG